MPHREWGEARVQAACGKSGVAVPLLMTWCWRNCTIQCCFSFRRERLQRKPFGCYLGQAAHRFSAWVRDISRLLLDGRDSWDASQRASMGLRGSETGGDRWKALHYKECGRVRNIPLTQCVAWKRKKKKKIQLNTKKQRANSAIKRWIHPWPNKCKSSKQNHLKLI